MCEMAPFWQREGSCVCGERELLHTNVQSNNVHPTHPPTLVICVYVGRVTLARDISTPHSNSKTPTGSSNEELQRKRVNRKPIRR